MTETVSDDLINLAFERANKIANYRFLGSQDIPDVVQDVVFETWSRYHTGEINFDSREQWLAYISTATKNRLLNAYFRGKVRNEALPLDDPQINKISKRESRPTENEALDSATNLASEINEFISEITEFVETHSEDAPTQYLIFMALLENKNCLLKDIAFDLNMSTEQFKGALHRLRATLNKEYGHRLKLLIDQ